MSDVSWDEAIRQWRALLEEEKCRRRKESSPRGVAASSAFEGGPVDLAMLVAEQAKRAMPKAVPKRGESASSRTENAACVARVSSAPSAP